MNEVIAVSKRFKDVLSETDPNNFIFHSSYNSFKIIVESTISITLAASTTNQTFTVGHRWGFIPLVTAFAKRSGVNQVFLPNSRDIESWSAGSGWDGNVIFNYIEAAPYKVFFNFDNNKVSTVDLSIRYFLLEAI